MAMANEFRSLVPAGDSQRSRRVAALFHVIAAAFAVGVAPVLAASFGSQQVVNGVKVQSVFKGAYGAIYVTFSPSLLTGCNGSYGGYMTSTWSDAAVGSPTTPDDAKMQLALLLTAKTTEAPVEVRYRVNTTGTGWDRCAIDAIWLQ